MASMIVANMVVEGYSSIFLSPRPQFDDLGDLETKVRYSSPIVLDSIHIRIAYGPGTAFS